MDALTAFGMEASDTEQFVDLLASTASNSNTTVEGMGEAFKYVAPVVGALGASADDTALALGLMANASIKGGMAGRQLRTMVNRLVSPTKQGAEMMKKYNIEVAKGADGSVDLGKSMDNLRKSMRGLDKDQQSAAVTAMFGAEAQAGVLAIINASEKDYKDLTKATNEYTGAAEKMRKIMDDNLEGSFEQLKSNLAEVGLQLAEVLIPMVEKAVEWFGELVTKFTELDKEQREQIVKWGLIAMAAGPALSLLGKGVGIVGNLTSGAGKLAGVLAGGKGASSVAGSFALLGPGGKATLAVAGIGAVSYAIKKLYDSSQDAKRVNAEVADSFLDTYDSLSGYVKTFDELSEKSGLTNDQLARMHELQGLIGSTDDQAQIDAYTKEYERLKEESGLTTEEIERLFEANDAIIDQTPGVAKSINSQGDAFVKSTDKAREFLGEISGIAGTLVNLGIEQARLREPDLLTQRGDLEKRSIELDTRHSNLSGALASPEDYDIPAMQEEVYHSTKDKDKTWEEQRALAREMRVLKAIEKGDIVEATKLYESYLGLQIEAKEKVQERINLNQSEMDGIEELNDKKAGLHLREIGINEEGQKGLAILSSTISSLEEEIDILEQKKASGQELTREEQERLGMAKIDLDNALQKEQAIFRELGLCHDINELAQRAFEMSSQETQDKIMQLDALEHINIVEGDILGGMREQSEELSMQHDNLVAKLTMEGATTEEIDKQTQHIKNKMAEQELANLLVLQELGLWDNLNEESQDMIINTIKQGEVSEDTIRALEGQGFQIDGNNALTGTGIGLEEDRTAEAGKDVSKNVDVSDGGKTKALNVELGRPISKRVNIITRVVDGVKGFFGYAQGTPLGGHPGGMALVGDGRGEELIINPDGGMFLSPPTDTYMNLARGTHVLSHEDTKSFFRNIPKYAQGTIGSDNILKASESKLNAPRYSNSNTTVDNIHSGTITVRGINNKEELVAITEHVISDSIKTDSRRLPDRPRLIPN